MRYPLIVVSVFLATFLISQSCIADKNIVYAVMDNFGPDTLVIGKQLAGWPANRDSVLNDLSNYSCKGNVGIVVQQYVITIDDSSILNIPIVTISYVLFSNNEIKKMVMRIYSNNRIRNSEKLEPWVIICAKDRPGEKELDFLHDYVETIRASH